MSERGQKNDGLLRKNLSNSYFQITVLNTADIGTKSYKCHTENCPIWIECSNYCKII